MSTPPYIIRNYRASDFNSFFQLRTQAAEFDLYQNYLSLQSVRNSLERPNYSPEQDLFIVEIAGNTVGYMDLAPELTIGRIILDCWVNPEHRRRGLATKLLIYATRRAQELGAKVAHANIADDNVVAKKVLSKLGFSFVRRFLELRLDIAKVRWSDIDQGGLGCCHLQSGEEDKLTQIQNRAFVGTWGYNPNTVEEIIYRTNSSTCSLEDIVLTYERDKVIGYCWTSKTCERGKASERKGRIFMLGVDPDYRGRGVGKRVLLAGLVYLKSKGLGVADLTVDSENQIACALYRSIGFEVRTHSLWYEKTIDYGTGMDIH